MNRYAPDTIAILGADTLAEDILAQLLQRRAITPRVTKLTADGVNF